MANNITIGLIDADYIKANSVIFNNIEGKYIEPSIIRAQNIYIKELLGSSLYNVIIEAYSNNIHNGTAIPQRISYLTDNYIAPCLMHYVIYDMLPDFFMKITPQGLAKSKDTDNQTSVDINELNKMQNIYMDRAQFYASKVIDFLLLNTTDYPEYCQIDPDDSQLPTTRKYKGFYMN